MKKIIIVAVLLLSSLFHAWGVDDCDIFRFVCNYVKDSISISYARDIDGISISAKNDKMWISSWVYYDCGPLAKDLMEFPCEFDDYFVVHNVSLQQYGYETELEYEMYDISNHYPYLLLFMPDIDDDIIFMRVFFHWLHHYYLELYFKLRVKGGELFIESCDKVHHE